MSDDLTQRLSKITDALLDSSRPAFTLRSDVMELKSVFEAAGASTFDQADLGDGETRTAGGTAISPAMAAMCLDDFARTVQFIRGLSEAIRSARSTADSRAVRILYAGCGPWATLAVPLMTKFAPHEAIFTLLDIHPESIESVRRLVKALGLEGSVTSYVVADAAAYELTAHTPPDVIVVEMLRAALANEPQMAVSRSLIRQAPSALLVPSNITLDVILADSSPGEGDAHIHAGTILSLDRTALLQNAPRLAQTRLTVPDHDPTRHRAKIRTTIRVFGEHVLKDNDSGVTLPQALKSDREPMPGDILEFSYVISDRPGLQVRNLGPHGRES